MKIRIIRIAMISIVQMLAFFWFIGTIKYVLFWIYLWQLKGYHVGRFIDHFRTSKGKKVLFGFLPSIKLALLLFLLVNYFFFPFVFYLLLIFYIIESLIFISSILKKQIKKPALTFKTILLILVSFLVVTLYLLVGYGFVDGDFAFTFYILAFDILLPLLISLIVLFFQPFFVLARNSILAKARGKIKKYKNLIVVGITGSYGKTSTKEFLTTILSSKFKVLATPEHKNSEIGIAQTILKDLTSDHQIFVVEMGSYNKGGIKLLCDIVKPKIGVVTGVNEQHLATFGSLENLLSAEGGRELLAELPQNSLLVVNGDNKYCVDLYKKAQIKKLMYTVAGDKVHSDVWAEEVVVAKDYISFVALSHDKHMAQFSIRALGRQHIQNLLAAILVAKELGMSLGEISEACRNIVPEQAGTTLCTGVHGINIIDSSYSSNPDGVMADLDYLNVFDGKKVIVMPCLIELGEKSAEVHKQIGRKIAEVCDMAIITTKDKFEEIKSGAAPGAAPPKIIFSENPKEIFNVITTFCKEGDAVLLEGRVPGELVRLLSAK